MRTAFVATSAVILWATACTVPQAENRDPDDAGSSANLTCAGAVDDEASRASIDEACKHSSSSACSVLKSAREAALASCERGILRRFCLRSGGMYQEPLSDVSAAPELGEKVGTYAFALVAQLDGDPLPLFRCTSTDPAQPADDLLTHSATCEALPGYVRVSWSGYAYAPGTPRTAPLYRCRARTVPVDHFISRSPTCDGELVESRLGNVGP